MHEAGASVDPVSRHKISDAGFGQVLATPRDPCPEVAERVASSDRIPEAPELRVAGSPGRVQLRIDRQYTPEPANARTPSRRKRDPIRLPRQYSNSAMYYSFLRPLQIEGEEPAQDDVFLDGGGVGVVPAVGGPDGTVEAVVECQLSFRANDAETPQ